jgi:O-antigen/teichoic acid export membrane protein
MGVVIRESAKGSIASYVGAGIGAIVTLFIYPYFLSPEEVGFIRLLTDFALVASCFAMLGSSSMLVKFFPHFKRQQQEKAFMSFCFLVSLVGYIVVSSLILIFSAWIIKAFANNAALFSEYFYYALPFALGFLLVCLFETIASIYRRMFVSRLLHEMLIRVFNIAAILLYYFHVVDLIGLIVGYILAYGTVALLNYCYLRNAVGFNFAPVWSQWATRKQLQRIAKFGGSTILALLGGVLVGKIDVVMISSEMNLASTGVYSIAFYISAMIEVPARQIQVLVVPELSAALESKNMAQVAYLYKKTTKNQLLISGFLFMLMWINIDNIFGIMPNGEVYDAGKYVVLCIGLSKLFDLVTGINGSIINYSRYYYLTPVCTVFLGALAIVSNLILIPRYGITGAAIASLASMFTYNCIMLLLVKKLLHMQPFTWSCLRITAALLVTFGATMLIPSIGNPHVNLVVQSLVVTAILTLITLCFNLSDDVNELIRLMMRHVKKIFR